MYVINHSYYLVFIGLHTAEENYVSLVLRIGFTFLLDLNIVLTEAFFKMLSMLPLTPFTYVRNPGCFSTVGFMKTLEGNKHLVLMKVILHLSKLVP